MPVICTHSGRRHAGVLLDELKRGVGAGIRFLLQDIGIAGKIRAGSRVHHQPCL